MDVAAIAALVLAALPACTSSGSPSTTKDAGTDSSTWGASDCGNCVESSCTSEITDCTANPECAARLSCLRACPVGTDGNVDSKCETSCPTPNGSTGQTLATALDSCRQSASCTACGAAPSDAGDAGCSIALLCEQCPAAPDPDPCLQCQHEHCCNAYANCEADSACHAFRQCWLSDCPGSYTEAQCIEFCDQKAPGGYAKFAPILACGYMSCAKTCSLPACYDCLAQHCAKEFVACEGDENCFRASECLAACGSTQKCLDDCAAKYPGSRDALLAEGQCAKNYCAGSC